REVLVDVASGLRVPLDDGTRQLRREVYEFWPGEFLTLFEQAGIPRRVPPPFLPNNGSELASRSGQKPVIVSPSKKEIVLASTKRIPLRAKAEGDVREIFWFAGKQFVGKQRRIRLWSGPQQPAITKLPRWTITAAPIRTASLCDEDHGSSKPKIFCRTHNC